MRKITLFMLLAVSLLASVEDKNIIEGSAYGEKVVRENISNSNYGDYENREYYRREAIYNLILWSLRNDSEEFTAKKSELINLVDENKTQSLQRQVIQVDNNLTITGFCLIKDDINVGKQPGAGRFLCNTNIGLLEISGNLTPINEIATLLFDPSYIEFENWRYRVISSKVLNETRTSYNIATYVNDRKLSEIALEGTSKTADVFKTQSSEYMRQLEASRKKKNTEYVMVGKGGDGYIAPIQNENTEPPKASDYIIKGAIDVVSEVVKTTAEVFKKDLPYLYEIKGGSRIFIDLVIDKNGEKIQ